jgi:cytoskeletal protein CcmA (bactofilin family)
MPARRARVAASLLAVALAGCGGGSPSAPGPANVAGTWTGTATLTTATPRGDCIADLRQQGLPVTGPVTVVLSQSGPDLTGTVTVDGIAVAITGKVVQSQVSAGADGVGICDERVPCISDGRFKRVCAASLRFSGTVDGNVMTGSYVEIDQRFDVLSGAREGDVVVQGTFELRR